MPNLMLIGDTSAQITTTPTSAAGLALLDDADAAAQRTTLGLGTAATAAAAAFEAANANIQAHVISAHAPADAQKNSDITKAEIEAKLIGEIASHSHAGGGAAHATSHQNGGSDEISVAGLSGLLADAQTPLAHTHTGVYEPANANIQAHVQSAHAPANAQKNSDILKAEIEAVLTGAITSHSHAGGSGPTYGTATLAFGAQPGASYVTVDVTGLSGLTAASYLEAFFQGGDTTASNGADDHALAGTIIPTTCQYLTASSFRIHAMCAEGGRAWGDFKVRYAFA